MIPWLLAASALVVNEILYDPAGADAGREFVEIWNGAATPEAIAGLCLDSGDGAHPGTWHLVWQGSVGTLAPGDLLVVGGDSISTPHRLAADLQNGPDALRLRRGGTVLDVVGYGALTDPSLFEGHPAPDAASASVARSPDGRDTDDNSADFVVALPTPGRRNVLHRNWSLALRAPDPAELLPGRSVQVRAVARNGGIDTLAAGWEVRATLRGPCAEPQFAAAMGAPSWPVEVRAERCAAVPADSCILRASWVGADGLFRFEMDLQAADEDSTDDVHSTWVRVGAGPVVVNEIQFAPESGACEWVELWNRDRETRNLRGWTLEDASGRRGRLSGAVELDAGAFAVAAADTATPLGTPAPGVLRVGVTPWNALNNTDGEAGFADALVLRDAAGVVVDALRYSAAGAGEKGRSLERLMPDPDVRGLLWAPCKAPERATPGRTNSSTAPARARTRIDLAPNPFTPDGDGRDDLMVAVLEVPAGCAGVRARIFDMQGRCRATLADDRLGPGPRHLVWDGRGLDGVLVISGIYLIDLELYARGGASAHVRRVVGVRRE